jgi:hypothetical protein
MGVHNKQRKDKNGDVIPLGQNDSMNEERDETNISAMDLEIN